MKFGSLLLKTTENTIFGYLLCDLYFENFEKNYSYSTLLFFGFERRLQSLVYRKIWPYYPCKKKYRLNTAFRITEDRVLYFSSIYPEFIPALLLDC